MSKDEDGDVAIPGLRIPGAYWRAGAAILSLFIAVVIATRYGDSVERRLDSNFASVDALTKAMIDTTKELHELRLELAVLSARVPSTVGQAAGAAGSGR